MFSLVYITVLQHSIDTFLTLPASFYNLNTIFLSILIEAVPFVLIGVLIAGMIQIFITEDHIKRWIPKNKFAAVTMGCVVGASFPACECGIVPIIRRLLGKGVPIYAAVGFLLTGPLINPIVILSTYMAFGNELKVALNRMVFGFIIAMIIGFIVSLFFKNNPLKPSEQQSNIQTTSDYKAPFTKKLVSMMKHSIDEFFDMGKYLIIGAFLAAFVQTYVATGTLLEIGTGLVSSTVVMMGLAYLLSLCSEADAFIGASFKNLFPTTAIMGFLIYGPMLDLKNTIMMLHYFKARFVVVFSLLVTVIVFVTLIAFQGFM
ncbi:permease [Salirhabdus salicampi]|uniref:permease n=1 Tax=Salirhabdus salicampi TaxID=476102 RepID=UPI0020C5A66B|nr:permease [Salirhabdus salicampi]MCP8615427.1 permease [Salirhabdus salicampi]